MTCSELKKYIYKQNYIAMILDKLGCSKIKDWPNRVSCCNPDGDNPTACVVYKNENLNVNNYTRNLQSINASPDLITLVQFYMGSDFRKAILWLHKLLNLDATYEKPEIKSESLLEKYYRLVHPSMIKKQKKRLELDRNKSIDEKELYNYNIYPYRDFIIEACISNSTIKKFELGYSEKYQRTIIPVRHWSEGTLIGIRGRTSIPMYSEIGIPKYFPLLPFSTGCELYGLYENYDSIVNSGRLIIFEGEKSVLKLDSLQKRFEQINNKSLYGVAVFGHNISDEQAEIIKRIGVKDVTIAFDKDVSADEIIRTSEKMLAFIPNLYYIDDSNNLLGDKDSPIDGDIETFSYLYNNRKLVRDYKRSG